MNGLNADEFSRIGLIQTIFNTANMKQLKMFVEMIRNENKLNNSKYDEIRKQHHRIETGSDHVF